jgi:Ca2+-binding RTX toxin-like protein
MAGALLYAGPLSGGLTATLTGATQQIVSLGSGDATITDNAAGAKIYAANTVAGHTLTLIGSGAESVFNLAANLDASGLTGALNVTTRAVSAISIATGSGSNTIHAEAMSANELLNLAGSHAATVYLGGDLSASGDTGALTVFATGTGAQTIQTGSGDDTITATLGDDTIQAGAGADSINVAGHTASDSFVYSSVDDSANTATTHDTIAGFAASGAFHDTLDFSALNPNLSVAGELTGGTIAANSIGWVYSGGDAQVFVNNTGGALNTTSASLLEVTLSGVSSGLAASLFKA